MKKSIFLVALAACLFCFACSTGDSNATVADTANAKESTATSTPPTEASAPAADAEETPVPYSTSDKVVSWVEKLNIREAPNKTAKVVAQAKENESLRLTGKKSDHTETIELRGKSYTEPWIEVKTADGQTGWVFAGAVKMPGENKGNALNTASKFTYPHFGSFDQSEWEKIDSGSEEGGDAEIETTTYKKGNQLLEIAFSDVGEYGWHMFYTLMDASKKVLKERSFSYSTDGMTITETVKDHSSKQEYTRSNELKNRMSYDQSKSYMAKGNWKISSLANTKSGNTKKMLGSFEQGDCSTHVSAEFDCACNFKEGDPYKGATLFASNFGKHACVKVNGELNALYPDWEERDYKADLKKLAASKDWIKVSGSEISYFGKPLADYKYENPVAFLTDLILVAGKTIDAIPIQTTTGGAGIDIAKGYAKAAIAKAKLYQSKGGSDPLTIVKYDNRRYDVILRYRQVTQHEGEANEYEGELTLLKNRSTDLLETRVVNGTCGC